MIYHLTTPVNEQTIAKLQVGDQIYLSGTIYTARDAAHKRLVDAISAKSLLPIQLEGTIIYYAGPTPAPPGHVIGSIGPTTSIRMDRYYLTLVQYGQLITIGKGKRTPEVVEAIKKYRGLYLGAIGGLGALISEKVEQCEIVAYEDLGTEAIRRLEVKDLPLIVLIDSTGNSLY